MAIRVEICFDFLSLPLVSWLSLSLWFNRLPVGEVRSAGCVQGFEPEMPEPGLRAARFGSARDADEGQRLRREQVVQRSTGGPGWPRSGRQLSGGNCAPIVRLVSHSNPVPEFDPGRSAAAADHREPGLCDGPADRGRVQPGGRPGHPGEVVHPG